MRSMTGYGRGQSAKAGTGVTAEVRTVNHRFLDVSVRLPKSVTSLEIPLRKRLGERFSRGRIEFSLSLDAAGARTTLVSANLPLAREYAQAARQIADAAGIKGTLKLSTLMMLPEVLSVVPLEMEADLLLEAAMEALEAACDAADSDRQREGEQLKLFFEEHLSLLEAAADELETAAPQQPLQAQEKLLKRLSTLPDVQADPQRLAQEIALFSDRCDISEEISRLKAHCLQIRELLRSQTPVGRELDFLAQELNREGNTICSKSASLQVTRLGLVCKGEAEKIREQIQNVE